MAVILGTVSHGSSGLAVTLDRALESLPLGNSGSIYLIAVCKDISLDLLCQAVLFCIFKTELS